METFSLLLLGLGLVFAGAPESITEVIKEEFLEEEMQYDTAKCDQEKQTVVVLMNWTLLDRNTSLSMFNNVRSFSLLTFRRLRYSFPQRSGPDSNKKHYNDVTVWRKVSEANGSCKSSNNFIYGSTEVICGVSEAPSCKSGQNPGISCSESLEHGTTTCQLTMGKQSPRCQHYSVTSLKKMLVVLTSHTLMSWLVSDSKL
ncbi:probable ribonuclease 11 [Camelus dromedarius]|uniref:Ribonuclease 11 n=2 Tax=Camelus TaxID=9836 RepID=A0A9W3EHP8_CAMBA|nr:probable ribonuclease 11 [Camelus ferus]XP_010947988.1 probable ribonuclease 11 [Camelus bactrianus]XP_010988521.1 probable ribonuclease 11 [Camelus dromedarius]